MEIAVLLRELSEALAPSGFEAPALEVLERAVAPWVDRVERTSVGTLLAVKEGEPGERRVLVATHIDEIGLMVQEVTEEGFLRVAPLGGIDPRMLPAQRVRVHTASGPLLGVVGTRPPHVLKPADRTKAPPLEALYVDLGLDPETVRRRVAVGDPISLEGTFRELRGRRVSGKALDNRASAAVAVRALSLLKELRHPWTVVLAATVQEETTFLGAATAAFGVRPDAALVVDVTHARGPGVPPHQGFPLGKGPAIGRGPNLHPGLTAHLRRVADDLEIPYHLEPLPAHSGTDAWPIQVSREGIPTGLISLPLRYMHTPVEVVDLRDLERAARLLAHAVVRLEEVVWAS